MKNNRFHVILLLICAFFWGTTFAAQSIGADLVGPYTFLAGRSWLAVVLLTPVIHVIDYINDKKGKYSLKPKNEEQLRRLIITGIICGTFLCLASAAQQAGMAYTTTAKASFITTLYVVLVPIFSIFLKKKPPVQITVCVFISLLGMILLCLGKNILSGEALAVERGDALVILCAVLFALQVMSVAEFGPMVDGVRLSRVQFTVVAVESTVLMLLFEQPAAASIAAALPAIMYAGVFSSCVAYTLQIIGMKDVNPTLASLVMSLESVFGALAGWVILGERMLPVEMAGGALMFAAVILAQIPLPQKKKSL